MQLCFHKGLDSANLPCFMGHWYPTISDIGSKCPFFAILGGLIGCLISVNGPYISLENLWEEKAGEIHQGLICGIPAMTCQRQFQLLRITSPETKKFKRRPLIKMGSCYVLPPLASQVGIKSGFLDLQICIKL